MNYRTMRLVISIALVVLIAAVAGVRAGAGTGAAVGAAVDSNRVLRTFDFEERQLGNAEDLPMHWDKVDGPELPHYVTGRLTTDRHRSGQYSFRMDLNGGSCIYRYEPGQIRVQRNAHYRVEGY